ncbi:MAG: DUF1566 domain-containing protein [Nitrospinales bacterium]
MSNFAGFLRNQVFLLTLTLGLILFTPAMGLTEMVANPCVHNSPYEAPEYVPPPPAFSESKVHLIDNEDGTISDPDRGLMWAQKDSYSDLNKCLTMEESRKYVEKLKTAGHSDWRFPTINELASLYDDTQSNVMAWDHNPDHPLYLSKKFSDGAAYWYWSSTCGTTKLTECCAKTLYFVNGLIELRRFELCNNGGVRAVRNIPKR